MSQADGVIAWAHYLSSSGSLNLRFSIPCTTVHRRADSLEAYGSLSGTLGLDNAFWLEIGSCLTPAESTRANLAEPVSAVTAGGPTVDLPWSRRQDLVVTAELSRLLVQESGARHLSAVCLRTRMGI